LNFNQKGSVHNTFVGGVFSVILYAFITFFIADKVRLLVTHGDDKLSTVIQRRPDEALYVNNDVFIWINKLERFTGPYNFTDIDLEKHSKYIDMNYYLRDVSISMRDTDPKKVNKYRPLGIR
jgi:hypothetical protein